MRPRREDEGSITTELVILAPVLLIALSFIVLGGRIAVAANTVTHVADAAAREASLQRNPEAARAAAEDAALVALATSTVECTDIRVAVDTSDFTTAIGAEGSVSAQISCTVPYADLLLPGAPGAHTITREGHSPIDPWRQRR